MLKLDFVIGSEWYNALTTLAVDAITLLPCQLLIPRPDPGALKYSFGNAGVG